MNKQSPAMQAIRLIEKKLYAYRYAIALVQTDEATVAPTESNEGRGTALEVLSADVYAQIAGTELSALLNEAEQEPLCEAERAEITELRRQNEQYVRIPAAEYAADERLFNDSRSVWHKAKAANDYPLFAPYLERCIRARQRWAAYFDAKRDPYEVWLDQYQPGLTIAEADAFFTAVQARIVPLLQEIRTRGRAPRTDFLEGHWDIARQKELSDYVMGVMGLSREHCVLGETEHPFTQQLYDADVRITTHYYESDFLSSLFSVIHEGGHALYELHISPALRYTVLAEGSCTAIHESQSRLFENYIGRSREFLTFLWPKLNELFPEHLGGVAFEDFYRAVNRVEPSLIRTEADELTYVLHVLIRYQLEKQLLQGTLTAADLPAAWNRLYLQYLGVDVPDDAHGVLQDVHWSEGDFGYFPGYALGTAYAAQMVSVMCRAFDFSGCCLRGDLAPILAWQSEHLWQYGKSRTPDALISSCCAGPFSPEAFLSYLETKYRDIYQL